MLIMRHFLQYFNTFIRLQKRTSSTVTGLSVDNNFLRFCLFFLILKKLQAVPTNRIKVGKQLTKGIQISKKFFMNLPNQKIPDSRTD